MRLIPQTMQMACWYASARMVIQWRRNRMKACEVNLEDPSEDPMLEQWKKKDAGISDDQIVTLAKRLGLELVPPMSPSLGALESWLKTYGPLWTNGTQHITVIAGIRGMAVLVYDPWPPKRGHIGWRGLSTWYIGTAHDSRDVNTRSGVFMHCPR
jgi:ABC-type bacteriocin/lantibiotic exporter with double-glycine peptidase domain